MGRKKRGTRGAAPKGSPAGSRSDDGDIASNTVESKELPERLQAVRAWIAAGGHNRPEVAEAVARRILERGELRDEREADSMRVQGRPDSLIH